MEKKKQGTVHIIPCQNSLPITIEHIEPKEASENWQARLKQQLQEDITLNIRPHTHPLVSQHRLQGSKILSYSLC